MSLAFFRSRRGIVAASVWWLVAIPTVIFCLFQPWLPDGFRQGWYAGHGELMLLGLAATGAFWRAEFSRHAILKRWWRIFATALSIWYVAALLGWFHLVGDGPLMSVLATDIGYCAYYVLVIAMLDEMVGRPHRITASLALVFALFGYIIVLPAVMAPEEYHSWVPSYLFYVSLDIYIFARVSLLLKTVWRTRVGLDIASLWLIFFGILISDLLDGLWNVGIVDVPSIHPASGLLYLPLLPLLLITSPMWRMAWQRQKFELRRTVAPDLERIVYWLLPLGLHLVGYGFQILDNSIRNWRDAYLLVWLLVVVAFEVHRKWRVPDFEDKSMPSPNLPSVDQVEPLELPPTGPEVSRDPLLDKLDAYLANHLAETGLSLEHLGEKLAMSPRQIQRRLKAATGMSPSQYLLEHRLQKAAELLKAGNKSTYVAHATGFSQQSHFTRRFKERFGVTPGQFTAA